MSSPDNTTTQPIPRIPATAPIGVTRPSWEPLPDHLSPRGLPIDEAERPYEGDPPPFFGRMARAMLAIVACTLIGAGLLTAFQLGQLSIPTTPFAGNQPSQQATTSVTPSSPASAKPTRAPVVKTTPQPTLAPTPDDKNDIVPVVDKSPAPVETTAEATPTPTDAPSTPSSEPSTPETTAPATTQPPTSTPPVPTDQPTASAPPSEDLETTPPTE